MRTVQAFPADPRSVRAARRFVLGVLAPSSPETQEAAELLVSELATNAVRHVHSDFAVSVERDAAGVRVEVTDHGGGSPVMRAPQPDEPSGRGLRIIDMLSDSWGIEPHAPAGKTVWFTLAAER